MVGVRRPNLVFFFGLEGLDVVYSAFIFFKRVAGRCFVCGLVVYLDVPESGYL